MWKKQNGSLIFKGSASSRLSPQGMMAPLASAQFRFPALPPSANLFSAHFMVFINTKPSTNLCCCKSPPQTKIWKHALEMSQKLYSKTLFERLCRQSTVNVQFRFLTHIPFCDIMLKKSVLLFCTSMCFSVWFSQAYSTVYLDFMYRTALNGASLPGCLLWTINY